MLLILFLGYYSGAVFFPHAHIVNGKTIVHSHPYNPFSKTKNSENHHHSKNEFFVINLLSTFLSSVLLPVSLLHILKIVLNLIVVFKNVNFFNNPLFLCINGFRAPPF